MNIKKLDGSFNIEVNGKPYNTIEGEKYYKETLNLYNTNPEIFEEEQEVVINQEELKQNQIGQLKNQISNEIYEIYPLSKQIDILGRIGDYTDNDFNNMKDFIENKISEYKTAKSNL